MKENSFPEVCRMEGVCAKYAESGDGELSYFTLLHCIAPHERITGVCDHITLLFVDRSIIEVFNPEYWT